jgi:O-antigen/teichoic acid export membrane protein
LFAQDIIRLVSSEQYLGAWKILAITAFGFVFIALASILNSGVYYVKRSLSSLLNMSAGAAVNIAGNLLLIPRWGIYGAAISGVISGFVLLILNFITVHRFFKVSLHYRSYGIQVISCISLLLINHIAMGKLPSVPVIVVICVRLASLNK